jgi:ankyrin repeat protein
MREERRKAAVSGDAAGITRLLGEGIAIDCRDRYGQTALMLAATRGHDAVVTLLLAHGADPDVTAKYGLSALMLAVVNRHSAIARQLVDAGADLSLTGTGAPGFLVKTAERLARDAGLEELADHIAAAERPPSGRPLQE